MPFRRILFRVPLRDISRDIVFDTDVSTSSSKAMFRDELGLKKPIKHGDWS